MIKQNDEKLMRSYIQKIATGPHMSKNLSLEDARMGMQLILENRADPVQAAIFLIALRMKRETEEENQGILEAIRNNAQSATVSVDELVDLTDPFDGFLRHVPTSPFVPAVLAACGLPTVSHGVDSMGPKYGVTHRRVLQAAGIDVNLSPTLAAKRIENMDSGWSYVDQQYYSPGLHDMTDLRTRMVKRPCITTVEVMTGPIRCADKNYLVTGYVHKPYRDVYLDLARHVGYHSAIIIRGVEGGTLPSLRSKSNFGVYTSNGENQMLEITPDMIDIQQDNRSPLIPESVFKPAVDDNDPVPDVDKLAQMAADSGIAALKGQTGITYDSLVMTSAICLWQLGKADSFSAAAEQVKTVLNSGKALSHFQA